MRRWLSALLLLSAVPALAEGLPEIHLKIVGGLGQTIQYKKYEEPFWAQQLAEHSNGRITAEVTPWDRTGIAGSELLGLTRLGAISFGTISLSQIASEDPEAAGADLAGLNPDIRSLRASIDAHLPVLREIYRTRYGLELLAVWTYPAQVVFCNKPIRGLADLRGRKVRVASAMHGDFVRGLGGVDVAIPYNGLMDAFRKGVTDCAITAAMSGYQLGLHQVTTHLDPVTVSWGPYVLLANHAAWTRLGPTVQRFIERELADLSGRLWQAAESEGKDGVTCLTGNGACSAGPSGHMRLVEVGDEDRKLVRRSLLDAVLPRWTERCGEQCVEEWDRTVGRVSGVTAAEEH